MYLQSFEFAILAESTNETMSKFKQAKVLFHFHDGNVIAVKSKEKVAFLKEFNKQLELTSKKLNLTKVQKIEVQNRYPKN